jgi:hypothetical protein
MSTTNTQLVVTNYTNQTVLVYVTFAASNPSNACCPSPVTVGDFSFLTPVNSLRGSFTLAPSTSQTFDPNGQCFSGNIGFFIPPQCPVEGADFNNGKFGTNIAEFTLNPNQPCFEAFDISCVNGVNCFIQMRVDENLGWAYGPNNTPITLIYNDQLQKNSGLPGVYPVNCTDCIQLVGNAPCPSLPIGPAQTERICNIQRAGRGGNVHVNLMPGVPM